MRVRRGHTKVVFPEVSIHVDKQGKCEHCGLSVQRTKKFWQTINPWNQKTPDQIKSQLREEASKWKAEPIFHAKCENLKHEEHGTPRPSGRV